MAKHPLDHDHGASKGRMEHFAKVERGEQPSAATRNLQQRERAKGDARVKNYTRIEKSGEV